MREDLLARLGPAAPIVKQIVGTLARLPDDAARLVTLTTWIATLPENARDAIVGAAKRAARSFLWAPNGPGQELVTRLVRDTRVDIIYYGGQPGAGKTHLALCLAATYFRSTIFLRRKLKDLLDGDDSAEQRALELFSAFGHYNAARHNWIITTGGKRRALLFAGCLDEKQKEDHRGKGRECYIFDEGPQFSESIVRFITSWRRTRFPGQRTLVLITGNPPTTDDGEWVLRWFAPWIDPTFGDPARPGEIRWAILGINVGDAPTWVEGPGWYTVSGERRQAQSLTFVPSVTKENPLYADGSYDRVLDAAPEPYRTMLRSGSFFAGRKDAEWQVIPTAWIQLAQARWKANPISTLPDEERRVRLGTADQWGQDVAHGGADSTAIAGRWGKRVETPETWPGRATPDGLEAARLLTARAGRYGGIALVDATGVGASAYDEAKKPEHLGERAKAVIFGAASERRDASGLLGMANVRALLYWHARDLLDPRNGHEIELPPHPHLLGDLTSARWRPRLSNEIQLDPKDEQKKRLGRSPDVGEAVLLALLDVRLLPETTGESWSRYFREETEKMRQVRQATETRG